jgi:hypothetical protein
MEVIKYLPPQVLFWSAKMVIAHSPMTTSIKGEATPETKYSRDPYGASQ